jgi:hypothetical protein
MLLFVQKGKVMKKNKYELVMLKDGKEISRVNLDNNLYVVLNDRETFGPATGASIWQDETNETNQSDTDYEQVFKGYDEIKGLKKVMGL